MHVWQWLFTGIVAGLIARLALRRSPIGLGGDLALGALGGLAAGALLRLGGLTDAGSNFIHVAVALTGAVGVIAATHGIARLAIHATRIATPGRSLNLRALMADADSVEREVVEKFLQREPVSREEAAVETLGQRVADRVAQFGGSWTFIGLFAATLFTWMLYNVEDARPFDPFPFILLNLLLSCLAAVQAPIILMSQNRQAEKDRHHVQADYAVNLKAEVEILALHAKIDELRERAWRELLEQQQRQLAILERLEKQAAVGVGTV
ncbi:MAG TPA: DUF1003 domain-containing protein [Steroidobacteraceae bacterium]|jgi:uncharacterized membrane protein/uncharacterized membrane protein YeaQ/YmgE (transglycosylase-associated protein family)|nr:DUF1003 domain-containing protein [Steroidobacteraceae bacterium]